MAEMMASNAEPAFLEEQQIQNLTRDELQRAIRNYDAQRQVRFRARPSAEPILT